MVHCGWGQWGRDRWVQGRGPASEVSTELERGAAWVGAGHGQWGSCHGCIAPVPGQEPYQQPTSPHSGWGGGKGTRNWARNPLADGESLGTREGGIGEPNAGPSLERISTLPIQLLLRTMLPNPSSSTSELTSSVSLYWFFVLWLQGWLIFVPFRVSSFSSLPYLLKLAGPLSSAGPSCNAVPLGSHCGLALADITEVPKTNINWCS